MALIAEQFIATDYPGVVFREFDIGLRRDSKIAWRADNTAAALREYVRIVQDLFTAP
jgi:hypothetical protein